MVSVGNTVQADDDARNFYDRSLGTITNGTASAGPYQLKGAANDDKTGRPRAGHLLLRAMTPDYRSRIAATYKQPSRVQTYVMSPTQTLFGVSTVNSRLSTLSAPGWV